MRPSIALAALLLATACHPHAAPSLATGRDSVTLDGVTMSSIASPPQAGQAGRGDPPTGAAAGTAIAAFLHPDTMDVIDPSDRPHLERALIRAHNTLPGEVVEWHNQATGNRGTVTPGTARRGDAGMCQDMEQTVTTGGTEYRMRTAACRQPDGTWARTSP